MLTMLHAAGLLVFRRLNSEIQYLLLQASYGDHHWSPPKGHVDPGENNFDTALRETSEEAGLQPSHLNVNESFQRRLNYIAHGKDKCVVYWLAELKSAETPIKLSKEHQAYKWLPMEPACKLIAFADMQNLIYEADKFIRIHLP